MWACPRAWQKIRERRANLTIEITTHDYPGKLIKVLELLHETESVVDVGQLPCAKNPCKTCL